MHHDSDASWDDIDAAVRRQIAEVGQQEEEMRDAMRGDHEDPA